MLQSQSKVFDDEGQMSIYPLLKKTLDGEPWTNGFSKALSKDERAAIMADIEEEKQKKMQVLSTSPDSWPFFQSTMKQWSAVKPNLLVKTR